MICQHDLVPNCIRTFLPPLDPSPTVPTRFYGQPQYLALKLLRVLAGYGDDVWKVLDGHGAGALVRAYVFCKRDLSIDLIKLQVEAYRLAKVVCTCAPNSSMYRYVHFAIMFFFFKNFKIIFFYLVILFIVQPFCCIVIFRV